MFGTIVVSTRAGAWLLAVGCLALVLIFPASVLGGQVSTPDAGEDAVYRDPAGRFSVPIPTNWVAEEHDGYVSIVTGDGKIALSIVVISGTSASAAIGEALELLSPAATPVALVATPLSEGDKVAVITADDGSESGRLVQAVAQRVGDLVFVLVLQGDLEAVGLRQVQVDKIFYGVQVDMNVVGSPVASPVS